MASYYPPTGFHFRVEIDGFPDTSFQEVTGITSTIETQSFNEGGENRFAHKLPKPASYQNLSLKRGMLIGSGLIGWFRDAVEGFSFAPKDITVTLLNEEHQPLEAWSFLKAYPVKWDIGGLNAQGNEIVIETIELAYQYFTRVEVHSSLPT